VVKTGLWGELFEPASKTGIHHDSASFQPFHPALGSSPSQ
jgi:hypothetical protein